MTENDIAGNHYTEEDIRTIALDRALNHHGSQAVAQGVGASSEHVTQTADHFADWLRDGSANMKGAPAEQPGYEEQPDLMRHVLGSDAGRTYSNCACFGVDDHENAVLTERIEAQRPLTFRNPAPRVAATIPWWLRGQTAQAEVNIGAALGEMFRTMQERLRGHVEAIVEESQDGAADERMSLPDGDDCPAVFTDAERQIIDLIEQVYNTFANEVALSEGDNYQEDCDAFGRILNQAMRMVSGQLAARQYPSRFRLLGE